MPIFVGVGESGLEDIHLTLCNAKPEVRPDTGAWMYSQRHVVGMIIKPTMTDQCLLNRIAPMKLGTGFKSATISDINGSVNPIL